MKKIITLAIAIALIAAPAMAQVYRQDIIPVGLVAPFTPNVLYLDRVDTVNNLATMVPGIVFTGFYANVVDENGAQIYDPVTQLPLTYPTFKPYMTAGWRFPSVGVQLKGVILQKKHGLRQPGCGTSDMPLVLCGDITQPVAPSTSYLYGTASNVLDSRISLVWPLQWETEGTQYILKVNYQTTRLVQVPGEASPRIQHVETFIWTVRSSSFAAFQARLGMLLQLSAGTCEIPVLGKYTYAGILSFFNGKPAVADQYPAQTGLLALAAAGQTVAAQSLIQDLEDYVYERCSIGCEAGCFVPSPFNPNRLPWSAGSNDVIVNTKSIPATSAVLSDLWAWGRSVGIMTD